jgi:hypothetical protein
MTRNYEGGLPGGGFCGPSCCSTDSQCDGGTNGRCTWAGGLSTTFCTYDTCFADTDCPPGVACECDPEFGNSCQPGNCRLDSDCACGFCSPSPDVQGCIPYFGLQPAGYYCHTPNDDCTNDDQCTQGAGVCAWQPTVCKWACVYAQCGG